MAILGAILPAYALHALGAEDSVMDRSTNVAMRLAALTVAAGLSSACSEPVIEPEATAGFLFEEVDLVSNVEGRAAVTDPNLINPWGLAFGPETPFWIANNGTSSLTSYDVESGQSPLIVDVRALDGSEAAPTALVFNPTSEFVISSPVEAQLVGTPATFLVGSEAGFISGWNESFEGQAVIAVDRSGDGASYRGLALATDPTHGNLLYATNFSQRRVDVFDGSFRAADLGPDAFTDRGDPGLPEDFSPFGIEAIGDRIYVTYARRDPATNDEVHGPGFGFVSIFATNGMFVDRIHDELHFNAPWGVAIAPPDYGPIAEAILIGNFGDGRINAYNADTGERIDYVRRMSDGAPFQIDGLWSIELGNGGQAGATNELFFTAGPGEERNGLFGLLRPISAL